MKVIPATLAVLAGGGFFAAEIAFNFYPNIPAFAVLDGLFTTEHSKARAAVSKLLLYPDSAMFDAMRTVKLEKSKYVCGTVNSKNRSGSLSGHHEFVYDVLIDFAAIDDEAGLIAPPQRQFRPCPAEEKPKPGPFVVDLEKANKIAKALPKVDIKVQSSLQGSGTGADKSAGSQNMGQQIATLGSKVGVGQSGSSEGAQSESAVPAAAPGDENEWRGDRPPKAWPKFAADDPLSKPGAAFTDSEALELAADVERRWKRFESGKSASRPSTSEIEEALRALLAIKQQGSDFTQAWAAFVRLRKIHHAAIMLAQGTR